MTSHQKAARHAMQHFACAAMNIVHALTTVTLKVVVVREVVRLVAGTFARKSNHGDDSLSLHRF